MRILKIVGLAAALCTAVHVHAQNWLTGGNNVVVGNYLGAAAGSVAPLHLRTVPNLPIEFSTANTLRMKLNNTTSYTIGSFAAQSKNGALGLCPNNTMWTTGPGPFSNLHLADATSDNMQVYGYRPWMRNGVTFTGNGDQGYIGQKYTSLDNTDVVIQWSDNPADSDYGTDRMRFLFTNGYNGSSTGARSLEGLEGMRLVPINDKEMNVGIGDFFAYGGDPTERLHVRDGRVRIQQLPTDPEAPTLDKYLVVGTDGVIHWRNLGSAGSGCEWTLQGMPGSNSHISTAYTGNPGCPQMGRGIGVGIAIPQAKLDVRHEVFNQGLARVAINASIVPNSVPYKFCAITATCDDPASSSLEATVGIGLNAIARKARETYGVRGEAIKDVVDGMNKVIGVYGKTSVSGTSDYQIATGIYGETDAPNAMNSWAGYFSGNVNSTGTGYFVNGTFVASDAQLKTNIQQLEDPLNIVMQIQAHRYEFLTDEFPQMNLPSGSQVGLVAQELEEVIPALVKNTSISSITDSMGVEITPRLDYKAVNYAGLVPYLIGAIQQQQATIVHLQEQVDVCCAAQIGGVAPQNGDQRAVSVEDVHEQRLLIIPNPVADLTTLRYYVPQAGKVSLQVSTSDGKPLGTLREELAEAGEYDYQWNTTKLAVGTYFCTLMLDGKVVVKRAVKVK